MRVLAWLKGTPRPLRWVAALAWMGAIFVLSAQPDLPHPGLGWLDLAISCSAHGFLYAILALLIAWALQTGRHRLLAAFALAMLYGLSDELHQTFVPGRVADPLDLLCNAAGAGVALGGWVSIRRLLMRLRGAV